MLNSILSIVNCCLKFSTPFNKTRKVICCRALFKELKHQVNCTSDISKLLSYHWKSYIFSVSYNHLIDQSIFPGLLSRGVLVKCARWLVHINKAKEIPLIKLFIKCRRLKFESSSTLNVKRNFLRPSSYTCEEKTLRNVYHLNSDLTLLQRPRAKML